MLAITNFFALFSFLIYRVELKVAMYIFSQKSKKQVSDFVKRGGLYKYEGGIKGC